MIATEETRSSQHIYSTAVPYPTQDQCMVSLNSFLSSGDFCRLLITFANNLNPNQDRQNVGSDLDPNV